MRKRSVMLETIVVWIIIAGLVVVAFSYWWRFVSAVVDIFRKR